MVRKATQRLKCRPRQGGGQQELQQAASSRRRHQARIAHRDGKRKGALYNEVAAQPRGGKSADPRWRAGGRGGAPMCRGLCNKASSADPELRRLRRGSTEPTTCKDLSCSPFPHLTGRDVWHLRPRGGSTIRHDFTAPPPPAARGGVRAPTGRGHPGPPPACRQPGDEAWRCGCVHAGVPGALRTCPADGASAQTVSSAWSEQPCSTHSVGVGPAFVAPLPWWTRRAVDVPPAPPWRTGIKGVGAHPPTDALRQPPRHPSTRTCRRRRHHGVHAPPPPLAAAARRCNGRRRGSVGHAPPRRRTTRLPGGCRGAAKFNLIALGNKEQTIRGNVHLERTEVLGAVAATGDVTLKSFSVNSCGTPGVCASAPTSSTPIALAAGGNLTTEDGVIDHGRVENVDAGAVEQWARTTHTSTCAAPVAGCQTSTGDGGLLRFAITPVAGGGPAHCTVGAADLTAASLVEVVGRPDPSSMVEIAVKGAAAAAADNVTLTNMGFAGWESSATLLSMCNVGTLTVQDVGLKAAVLAPETRFRGTSGAVNGTVIVADVESGVEFQKAPIDCPRKRRRPRQGEE
ncbi:hypothetical protein BU14_0404s0024 [Porphyra umbilicalis]|uniref:Choice-of-anchor A domain-containing protein n=1 Tax=Porphyra umbilicalis TaxID=2786 RepID=A0A1X6NW30_PORUM|nr:hypothetical protein BU14_0404s0024 [Porphyra umbilicalis]|eukprot:OSX72797.1 hypothetical protein BU14_0404s0024 [Porphyra umbilicalis]